MTQARPAVQATAAVRAIRPMPPYPSERALARATVTLSS